MKLPHPLTARLFKLWAILYLLTNLFVLWEMPIRLMTGYALEGPWRIVVWTAAGILLAGVLPQLLFERHNQRENWIDLLTSIPLDLILPAGLGLPWGLLRWIRVLRIAEAVHFQRTLAHWQGRSQLPPAAGRLVRLIFWIFLADHFIAIGWIGLGGTEGALPETMLLSEPFSRYVTALYWATTTLATVGYGDITPHTDLQRLYSIFVMFTGVGLFGYAIGDIATLVANLDTARVEHQRKRTLVNAFMSYRRFPRHLVEKVNSFYHYVWTTRSGRDQEESFAELPESLRTEIALHLNRRILKKVPLFQDASEEFLQEIVLLLEPRLYMPGDLVFREGDLGDAMFFVSSGSVEAFSESDPTIEPILMGEGSYFGEIALTEESPRTRSIRTTGFCELYELGKDVFDQFLAKYPEFRAHIEETIRTRRQ
jgi:voltage-gated potassium channel